MQTHRVHRFGGRPGCTGTVNLSGSQNGVEYELYVDEFGLGTPVATGITLTGDGNPIAFTGIEFGGDYTVVATLGSGCTSDMTGSATVVPDFDLVVEATTTASCGDTIIVTVKAGACGLTGLGSLQFGMQWADTDFEYVSGSAVPAALLPNADVTISPITPNLPNTLRLGWSDSPPSGVNIVAGDVLLTFELKAKVSTGSSTIDLVVLDPGDLEAMQSNFYIFTLPANTSGAVTFGSKPGYSVVIDGPANPVCPNTNISLSANVTGGAPGFAYTWNPNIGSVQAPAPYMHTGTTTYAVTVTDDDGCTTSATREVKDGEAPTIECPTDMTLTRDTDDDECTYAAVGTEFDPTFSDNCEASIAYELTGETTGSGMTTLAGVIFNDGETTVTWTVTDNSNNATSCSFVVNVEDNEDPTITTCPSNKMRIAPVCAYATDGTEFDATFDDNCSATIAYELTGATLGTGDTTLAGVEFNRGVTTVTWTVTDASNNSNSTSCSFTVTVGGDTPEIETTVQGNTLNNLNGPNTLTIQVCNDNNTVTGTALTQITALDSVNVLIQITDSENINTANGGPGGDTDRLDDLLPDGLDGPIGTTGATWQNFIDDVRLQTATQWGFVEITITPYKDLDDSGDFTAGDCLGTPIVVTIQVQPLPGATSAFVSPTAQDGAICSEESVEVNLGVNAFQLISGGVPTPADYYFEVTDVQYSTDNGATYPAGNSGYPVNLTPGVDYVTNPLLGGALLMESLTLDTSVTTPVYLRYRVTVKLANSPNCEGGTVTIRVVINPLPKLTAQTPEICVSENPFNLTSLESAITSASGTFEYEFDGDPVADPTMFTAEDDDVVDVLFTDAGTGCENWTTITFTVNPLPDMEAQTPAICTSDNPFDLTELEDDQPSTMGTFAYEFGGNPVLDPTMFTAVDADSVDVIFTDTATGCKNTTTITFTVFQTPIVDDIADQAACDSFELPVITGTNLTGNEAYYTGPGGTGTPYNAGDTITATTTLYIYDSTGTTPNCFDQDTFLITIIEPITDLTMTVVPSGDVCIGATNVQYQANVSGGTGPFTYAWCAYGNGAGTGMCNAGFTPGGSNANQTRNWTSAGPRSVRVTVSQAVCPDQNELYVFNVNADPTAPTLALATPLSGEYVCEGDTASATFTAGSGGAGTCTDEYQVSTDNGVSWNPYTPGDPITALEDTIIVQGRRACDGLGCDGAAETFATLATWPVHLTPDVSVSFSATEICAGDEVTLTFTDIAVTGHTFSITANLTDSLVTDFPVTFTGVTTGAMDTYTEGVEFTGSATLSDIVVTDDTTGCSVEYADLTVTVNPLPVMTCPTDFTVCLNDAAYDLTLRNPTPNPAGGTFSGDGILGNMFTPSVAGLGVTNITYTVTDLENCSNSCSFNITVNANPSSAFRPALTVVNLPFMATLDFDDDHEICAGGIVEYGAEAAILDGNTHEWSITPAVGATILQGGTARNVQVQWTTAGTYTLTFVVTNTNGCTSTNSLEVTVHANPTAAISPDPAAVCAGIDLALNGNPTGGSGTYTTHSWSGAGADSLNFSNIQEPTFNSAAAGDYELIYSVTDNNGCKGSDNITVTVHANPTASILPDPAAVCAGFDLALDGNPTGGSGTYTTHAWTDAGADSLNNAGIQQPTFNSAVAAPSALIYTVTDDNGCKGSDNITVTVNANPSNAFRPVGQPYTNPAPAGTITHDADHAICAGDTASYGALVTTGHTYVWSVTGGGTILTSSTLRNVRVQWASAGTLTLVVTHTATGCTSTDSIAVTVNPLPVMTCPDDITICEDADDIDLTTLVPTANPEGGTFSGTGVTAGVFAPPAGSGTYTITYSYTDGNGCTGTCTFDIIVNALPVTTCPANFAVCIDNGTVFLESLVGLSPPSVDIQSAFSGVGVSAFDASAGLWDFFPTIAGVGAHTITYSYTNNNNCTDTCEFKITVKDQPKLTATLNDVTVTADNNGTPDVGAFSVCDGGSVTITADFSDAATLTDVRVYQTVTLTNTSFGWCNGCQAPLGIFVAPTASSITLVDPSLPGTAVITFQAWQDANDDGVIDLGECTGDVIEYTITVNALPVISFGFNGVEAGHNASFEYCYDDSVGVTLHTEYAGMAPYSVTYTVNAGTPVTVTGLSAGGVIAASQLYAPGVYNLVVTNITDAKGCEASAGFLSLATATITINPAPDNAFRPVGENFSSPFSGTTTHNDDHEICAGGLANYGALATPAGGHTYLWTVSGGGTITQGGTVRNVQVQWANSGTLTLVVTHTATGCTSTNSIDVTVNPLPVMTCPTSPVNACTGTPLTLSGGLPTGGIYSGDGVISGAFEPDSVSGPGPNYAVTYTVTDMKGCVNTCTFDVIINALPVVECPMDFTVCEDDAAFALTGGMPAGITGVYTSTGFGVTENQFNPALAGDGVHTITYTYTDGNGCVNSCPFEITVNPCVTISGKIIWKGNGVTGVNLVNVALTGDGSDNDVTGPSGNYSVQASMGGNFTVTPTKSVNMFNGVTSADVTAIQQHLTGAALITDFFRLLAADVNKSNTISSVDAAIINQALIGNASAINIMNNTGSWRFVRTDYAYPNPAGPFTLPSFALYDKRSISTMMNLPGQDFWGVKTGDVAENPTEVPGPGIASPVLKPDPSVKPLVWSVRDRMLKAGETVELDFSVTNFMDIAAFQHGMRFDPSVLQYEGMTGTGTTIQLDAASNFGAYQASAGELRTLWSVAQGVTLPGVQPMYRVRFTVLQGGMKLSDILFLDSEVMPAVAYTTDLAPRAVQLVFSEIKHTGGLPALGDKVEVPITGFDLLQNRPNPFSDRTTIGFILTEACAAQLRVFDISGRELWRSDKTYPAGYHEEVLRLEELNATGMLYYELTTPQGKQTRKMMAVKM
ncbi:MAG: HYR domain-containing protein [Lewinellaceae bacterium]|nr:HYR domain-containing protein [Lewinellaceae bacterium]